MSKDAEMKDAQDINEEKKEGTKNELSKAELEKLTLEGTVTFDTTVYCGYWNTLEMQSLRKRQSTIRCF